MTKVCGDPYCEAIAHNCTEKNKYCKDCGGRMITINDSTYQKKYSSSYFQYDYESWEYLRPSINYNNQLTLF
jgi:hypothetical protein